MSGAVEGTGVFLIRSWSYQLATGKITKEEKKARKNMNGSKTADCSAGFSVKLRRPEANLKSRKS